MSPKSERNMLIAAVFSSAVTLGAAAFSAIWVQDVVAPALRGGWFEGLLIVPAIMFVCGSMWAWWWLFCQCLRWLGERE